MALNPETYSEFQRQIELQKEETKKAEAEGPKVKVDEDGTEYEWDETKKAWFPKLSVELMMKYQENYDAGDKNEAQKPHSYTDPVTKVTFEWNSTSNRWEPQSNNGAPCKYTDPNGITYIWSLDKSKWETDSSAEANASPTPNKSNGEDVNDTVENAANEHTYTDPKSGIIYKWDAPKQLWVSETGEVMLPSCQNNSSSYVDPKSGTTYNWNNDKQEWIPEKKEKNKKGNKNKKAKVPKRKASEPAWFDTNENKNTSVYISGLPPDISMEEYEGLMSKCGIIMPNPHTGKPKLKLYKDNEGNLKGDGLCSYLKKESLDLAIQLLDDSVIRGGYRIHVQTAKFELKGSYDPAKKPKMLSKKQKSSLRKEQEKMLDWKLARKDTVKKTERVLVFKNMFDPKEFEEDAVLITDIRDDLRKECEKFGAIKKVMVFDRHPEGVCSVSFKDFDEATTCKDAMNGRWFAGKRIEVAPWDGVTDYQVEETDKEREERINNWEKFLEGDNKNKSETTDDKSEATDDKSEAADDKSEAADDKSDATDDKNEDS